MDRKMYALFESTPYEGEWPIAYFDTEDEGLEALRFIYDYDEKHHPDLPRTDWDWGYFVRAIAPKTLEEFKAPYVRILKSEEEIWNEKTTLGGDNCYIGRGLFRGESDPNTDTGINVLTNS